MEKIKQRIAELKKELLNLRRDFHQHPELGFEEHRTAGVVENYLKNLGLHPQRMTKTGVVALLEGSKPHPVLMLRADMDALPIEEENDVAYKSKNKGIMHACGHDAHMAMLLVAAKILSENKGKIPGTIKFVFQPNEEIAGAIHMIADGVLENPTVDAVMGIHIWTPVASGKIAITPGPVMAGLDVFKVTIHGKGGHTGVPEDAVDPVIAAAKCNSDGSDDSNQRDQQPEVNRYHVRQNRRWVEKQYHPRQGPVWRALSDFFIPAAPTVKSSPPKDL